MTTRTLLLLFAAALALAGGVFNLRDRIGQKPVPSDGVRWTDVPGVGVVAAAVDPKGPAAGGGIYAGDVLVGVSTDGHGDEFDEITEARHVQLILDQVKDQVRENHPLIYWVVRRNVAGEAMREGYVDLYSLNSLDESSWPRALYLALVGLVYLGIGVYFLLRQGGAPYITHFFLICLCAFITHFFSPTAELRTHFDKAVDITDIVAFLLLGPLFVHFAAIYPARDHLFNRRRWLAALLYLPALALVVGEIVLRTERLRERLLFSPVNAGDVLERGADILFAGALLVSFVLFLRTFRQARSTVVRQQLKWIVWGIGVASLVFAAFYIPSRLTNAQASDLLSGIAIAPLMLIPLTLGYSIVRYRLMDVDILVRRSVAYIIATLSVALLFGSVMAVSLDFLRPMMTPGGAADGKVAGTTLLITAIALSAIAMLFAPMKNWVQERIDRLFYGEKYDYRMTLQDFGRTLSSTTDREVLLDSLTRRLKDVLGVERLAIFIEDRSTPSGFRLTRSEGLDSEVTLPPDFLGTIREHSGATGIVSASDIDFDEDPFAIDEGMSADNRRRLYYFVPCAARSRVVAVIAIGRLSNGALLSSEDLSLLRAISGYVAVALENAMLIEEQAQRAEELARLKEFNENIIESINVGVMVVNLQGRVVNWNGALEEIYGLRREEAIGRRLPEVFQSEMLEALREMITRSEHQPADPANIYKFRARAFDGRELTLNISLAPLHSKLGEVEGTLVAIEDVTSRVRLEEQLQQSDKLSSIGLLAAGVAHEVNTPLTGISSYSQMLMQQVPENDPRHKLLEKIHRQTSRASSIVNNLLNFSRVSDARMTEVDLNRVLDDTIQLLEAQLRNTQIEVVRDYDDGLPPALGNAPKLQQVFMNLILNARDAMPNGGLLKISTTAGRTTATISFSDSGTGIAPEHLAKIYDPFFTTKQIGQGTGLGLAVSYGIVQDHGGNIQVESNPGEGTHFHITLPLATVRQQLATASD
ncbi:MAG TPA: ATP-binding protein [Blastocatellia bacterium]|nr:ATP-binding protein [Blastocatellia bacterium]